MSESKIMLEGALRHMVEQLEAQAAELARVTKERDIQKEVADNQTWWVKKLRNDIQERVEYVLAQDRTIASLEQQVAQLQGELARMTKLADDRFECMLRDDEQIKELEQQVAQLQGKVTELETQLSEDVAPFKDVAGFEWRETLPNGVEVPVMRGSPNLAAFIAKLHSCAAELQADHDRLAQELTAERAEHEEDVAQLVKQVAQLQGELKHVRSAADVDAREGEQQYDDLKAENDRLAQENAFLKSQAEANFNAKMAARQDVTRLREALENAVNGWTKGNDVFGPMQAAKALLKAQATRREA